MLLIPLHSVEPRVREPALRKDLFTREPVAILMYLARTFDHKDPVFIMELRGAGVLERFKSINVKSEEIGLMSTAEVLASYSCIVQPLRLSHLLPCSRNSYSVWVGFGRESHLIGSTRLFSVSGEWRELEAQRLKIHSVLTSELTSRRQCGLLTARGAYIRLRVVSHRYVWGYMSAL